MTSDLAPLLTDQLDWHWRHQLRPRLEGLTDAEYFWRPVEPAWGIGPRGSSTAPIQAGSGNLVIDFAFPQPEPPPVTTIGWRLAHVIVGVLAMRNAGHFGGPPADYETWDYAGGADQALAQLDEQYGRWLGGVSELDDARLQSPVGAAEPEYADSSMARLVLHINREIIHHGAEIALLRDLWAAEHTAGQGQ